MDSRLQEIKTLLKINTAESNNVRIEYQTRSTAMVVHELKEDPLKTAKDYEK